MKRARVHDGKVIVINNYREICQGMFGEKLLTRARFDLWPVTDILNAMGRASKCAASEIRFLGPILNINEKRAADLARAYTRCFGTVGKPIRYAKWLPKGPYTDQVRWLLSNVQDLEMDFQSVKVEVQKLYRERYTLSEYISTYARLRKMAVQPVLNITVGIPGDDERSLFETLQYAYSLRPRAVRISLFTAEPTSYFFENKNYYRALFDERPPFHIRSHRDANAQVLKGLLQRCKMSADSYNYWKRAGGIARGRL